MQDTLFEDASALLSAVPLGAVVFDQDNRITFVNTALEAMFGYLSDELIGQSLALLLPNDCCRFQSAHAVPIMQQNIDIPGQHKQGQLLFVDVRVQHHQIGGQTVVVGFVIDVTERKHLEHERDQLQQQVQQARVSAEALWNRVALLDTSASGDLNTVPPIGNIANTSDMTKRNHAEAALRRQTALTQLLQDVAVAANQATTIEAALQTALDMICACVEWPVGHALIRDEAFPTQLISTTIWHLDDAERFATFRIITEALQFVKDTSLPGSVLASSHPRWIADMATNPMSKRFWLIQNIGVHAGFAFPVLVGNDVVAVLEFFANEPHEPDLELLEVLANVGTQLGRVVERVWAETALRASEERYRLIAENTADLITLVDHDGHLLYASPSFRRGLGYDPEAIINGDLLELIHPDDQMQARKLWRRITAEETGTALLRYRDDYGSWHWIETSGMATMQLGARYVVMVGHDVTEHRKAEEAIHAAELRYRTLVEQLPAIIYTAALDAHSSTTYVSPQIEQILGFTPEEWLADPMLWVKHLHPDDRDRVLASVELIQQSTTSILFEYRSFTRDGRIVWLEDTSKMVQDEDGHPLFMQGIVRDVTERKQAEEAIRRSEQQYRTLARNFPNGAVFLVDHDLRYIIAGGQALRSRMYAPEFIEGKTLDEVLPAHIRDEYKQLYLAALAGTQTFGEMMLQGRIYATSYIPVRNEQGDIFAAFGMFHDITERKRAEEEIQRSEQLYRTLARNFPKGAVLLFDENLCYTVADGRGLAEVGLSRELVEGRTVQEVFAPEVRVDLEALYHLALGGTSSVQEVIFRAHTYLMHAAPVADDQDRIVAGMATFLDITELKQAEHELREERALLARRVGERTADLSSANAELARVARLKDEFLANMSHELRTPLNAVLGFSETLREQVYGSLNPKQDHFLQMIEESGRDLLALINDILDLAKIDAGKMELDIEPTIVEHVCHASLRMVQQAASKKQIALQMLIDPEAERVLADPRRLKQVLVNLLSNAIKFTQAGGVSGLEVTSDSNRQVLHFTVWDTGIGIAPDQIKNLFQPFVQLDSQLTRQYDGTGLGLALVYRMIELHGGSVSVSSDVGVGSRFTVTLPWHRDAHLTHWDDPARIAAPLAAQPSLHRALIIEDSLVSAATLAHALLELNITTETLTVGIGATTRAQHTQPDVIFLAPVLPDMSGWEVLTQLKADPYTQAIPVIMSAARDEQQHGIAQQATAYLAKPYTSAKLQDVLHQAIEHGIAPTTARNEAWPVRAASEPQAVPTILIAEDNELNITTVADYLTGVGYHVVVARNGEESVAMAREIQPTLILMDVQMPKMDGLEATRCIRANAQTASIPIIALTALAMVGDRERCLAAGANAYFSKPVRLKELAATIATYLRPHIAVSP